MTLVFKPLPEHKRGIVLNLLRSSYVDYLRYDPNYIQDREPEWKRFDDDVFDNPGTVGTCGFISYAGSNIVGFASWDPRQYPAGIVGHNCILSEFRKQGFGTEQIQEIIKGFRSVRYTRAVVSTSEHPFFLAARRMYLSCGFHETRRFLGGRNNDERLIEYEMTL